MVMLITEAALFSENAAVTGSTLKITIFESEVLAASAGPEKMIAAVIAFARHRPGPVGDAIGECGPR
jgi:hypothetical protein